MLSGAEGFGVDEEAISHAILPDTVMGVAFSGMFGIGIALFVASGSALHHGPLAMVTLTIIATLTAAGPVLAVSWLITPEAIAFLLARRFSTMLWVAVAIDMAAMLAGAYPGFFLDSAPAPSIVLVWTATFFLAFVRRRTLARRVTQ